MQYVWSLIGLVSLVFSFSAVYRWIRLTSLFILTRKAQKYFILNVLIKVQFNPSGVAYGPMAADSLEEGCSVLNILVLC
jgi:hypothetical protein